MSTIDPKTFITDPDVLYILRNSLRNITNVSGIYNTITREIKTIFERADGEKVINGHGNCFIVLGNDRPAGISSGYGGKGFTGSSCIDLVAGHMGSRPIDKLFFDQVPSPKDFKNDAARIYISHMSDIDKYFEIPKLAVTIGPTNIPLENSNAKSAIGMKADHIRIIGREQIKIVTNHGGKNSLSRSVTKGGVSILAGYDKMGVDATLAPQPMVKGNNLVQLLSEMINRIHECQTVILKFMQNQNKFNNIMSKHTHQSNKAGLPTSVIIGNDGSTSNFKLTSVVLPDIVSAFTNNESISGEYFDPTNAKYINSNWNKVN